MAKHYHTQFNQRQVMEEQDFEVFYYEDNQVTSVTRHQHDYYEIYFFLEGEVNYQIGNQTYVLSQGDVCMIPPKVLHAPIFSTTSERKKPYRRMVLWLSPDYYQRLKKLHPDISYGFDMVLERKHYHFSTDFSATQILFNKMIAILEEHQRNSPFHRPMIDCYITSLLISLNRVIYQENQPEIFLSQPTLFSQLCDYIEQHLEEDLSLDFFARKFHMSKYHIAHVFKDSMGISLHQYVIKKRLYACKNSILSGESLKMVADKFGFTDYPNFYRAFKKEFGMSPKDFKQSYQLNGQTSEDS